MRAEKDFKRENGDTIKLSISLCMGLYGDDFVWKIYLYKRTYGKIKFFKIDCEDDYAYRRLPLGKERTDYRMRLILSHVSIEEIREVKMMIVEQIKESIE